jgi:hypothetical protein
MAGGPPRPNWKRCKNASAVRRAPRPNSMMVALIFSFIACLHRLHTEPGARASQIPEPPGIRERPSRGASSPSSCTLAETRTPIVRSSSLRKSLAAPKRRQVDHRADDLGYELGRIPVAEPFSDAGNPLKPFPSVPSVKRPRLITPQAPRCQRDRARRAAGRSEDGQSPRRCLFAGHEPARPGSCRRGKPSTLHGLFAAGAFGMLIA